MTGEIYLNQVKLMLRVLPHVANESCFALKGGTAINLFLQNMPRLSVDIDLAFLTITDRQRSMHDIGDALRRISGEIKDTMRCKVRLQVKREDGVEYVTKLLVMSNEGVVKIEPNDVFRGAVFQAEKRTLVRTARDKFEMSVNVMTLSEADLYGGKLCAALDRQHPRDLFDVMIFLKDEKIPEKIRKAFVVYLAGHPRPMHELLDPNIKDIRRLYESDFLGMTEHAVSCEELIEWQKKLPRLIRKQLSEEEIGFLISLKEGSPRWELMGIDGIETLPALQWKLKNIQKISAIKRGSQLRKLQLLFE